MEQVSDVSRSLIRNYVVYGEPQGALSPAFVHCHQMEVTGKSHNWHFKPHIHSNLFQIFLFENGYTRFTSNTVQIELDRPSILTIPENTVHEFQQQKDAEGIVISISYPLLDDLLIHYPQGWAGLEKMHLFQQTENRQEFDQLFSLGRMIDEELGKDEPGKPVLIRSLLGQLLIRILRLGQMRQYRPLSGGEDRNHQYFNAFQRRIKLVNSSRRQIKEYASELGITPVHLNRICQAVAGKSALQVVKEHLILEAERHLSYSSYSISEIAHLLDFAGPNYFSRFFKKATGLTPRLYRKQKLNLAAYE
ncbi:MAG: helix-turn-helix domain-containing protein [Saprospiraceae bacterium]